VKPSALHGKKYTCLVEENKKWRRVIRTFNVTICLFNAGCQFW